MFPSFSHRRSSKSYRRLLCAVFVLFFWVPGTAWAGHYFIQDLPDVIEVKHHKAIIGAGVMHSGELYAQVARKKARAKFAKKTGIALEQLEKWARFIDLMQIDGIGPKMVRLFNAAGIENLKQFKHQKAAPLYKKIRKANRGGRYSQVVPGEDVLKAWIKQARKLRVKLQ